MAGFLEITIPDIGGYDEAEVVEILAKNGDLPGEENPVITL